MPPFPRPLLAIALVALAVAAATPARAQPAPTLDQYLCLRGAASRKVDRSLRFTPHDAVVVGDHVLAAANADSARVDLRKAGGLCLPAGAPGTTLVDATTHLELYDARWSRTRPPQPRLVPAVQHVTNALGSEDLRVQQIEELLVPSSAVFDPPPAPASVPADVDDFTCYAADRLRAAQVKPKRLALASGLGALELDVRAPIRLCVPADVEGADPSVPSHPDALACYRATVARTRPRQASPLPLDVATANRFGTEQLTLTATFELCVPSTLDGGGPTPTATATIAAPTPAPSPTAIPNFTLRIDPATTTADVGESVHFTATADFANGDHADFTERVVWSSSSDAALAPNVAGDRGRIDTVDGGLAVISVVDAATGVSSTTTGGDAQLTVNWTLERIELTPLASTRGVGESIRLRATGHFKGGFTRLVTQKVVFASSDDAIALPTNAAAEAEHSRIVAVGPGTATLSANDPLSGVTSTASNDDVALTVVPALARCTILQTGPITIATQHDYQLTAHGFYPGGFERNLTQQVVWSSDAPAIVEAPNTDGDRSRLHMLMPGTAHVTAKDSISGLACETSVTFDVRVPAGLGILFSAGWDAGRPRRVGDAWHVRAIQGFANGGYKYVTQRVRFDSSDPTIAAAPNADGDRGRIEAVSGGTAQITATDPATGATSSRALSVRVLDDLTRVEISFPRRPLDKPLVVPHPFAAHLDATGHFGDGTALLEAKDVTFVSDNPAAVAVLEGTGIFRWYLQTVGFGAATISAVDERTGISSDAFGESLRVAVRGPLQSLEIVPSELTRRVGDDFAFAVLGHFEGGVTDVVSQDVILTSSDPEVVSLPYLGAWPHAAAAGESVLAAVDPGTGISSADSGGSVEITVVGPLQRLRVTPSAESRSVGRSFEFTAIGSDADGREINLTQDVTWSSSDPSVAAAINPTGNRSRVDTVAEGTAKISASDPRDSVSSTTTGDDATLVVSGILESLTLAAEHTELAVGGAVAMTATGHLVGGATVNLTQQVVYGSSDPSVVRADNAPGNRSSVTALAPGTAVISAHDPGTGIDTAPNATVTLTVVAP